jgi:short-subunit dehydrogenase
VTSNFARVLVVGGTSSIAQHIARLVAGSRSEFVLLGRDEARLAAVADDLQARGATVKTIAAEDLTTAVAIDALVDQAVKQLGGVDLAIVAHGELPEQSELDRDGLALEASLEVNALSPILCMRALGEAMAAQGSGVLVVISSVAGDRGRFSNFGYGASKAAVTAYASGLRARLTPAGAHVLTVKPGMVDTPMTAHLEKGPLFARPEQVARDIVRAAEKRRSVLYTPWFWLPILLVIRALPEAIFRRLKF